MSNIDTEGPFGENPNFNADDLEKYLQDRFGDKEVETPDEVIEEEVTEPTSETPEEETPKEEVEEELYSLGDNRSLSRSQIEAYYQFEERLRTDPNLQKVISDYLSPQSPLPGETPVAPRTDTAPARGATEIPEEYKDDPIVGPLYNKIAQLESLVGNTQASIQAQQAASYNSIVNRARSSFKEQYKLDDKEIARVEEVAVRLGAVPAFMSGVDPITGMPVKPDPLNAVTRAMEIAYAQLPEVRKAAEDRVIAQGRDDRVKKTKLSALSGPGTNSKKTPVPVTQLNESERRDAMVREVAEMMNGSSGN